MEIPSSVSVGLGSGLVSATPFDSFATMLFDSSTWGIGNAEALTKVAETASPLFAPQLLTARGCAR
jgi:hypothetical protein